MRLTTHLTAASLILTLLTPTLALAQEPYPVPPPIGAPGTQATPTTPPAEPARASWYWQQPSGKRRLVGFGTMFTGLVVALTAFDGDGNCGTGTTVEIEGAETRCVHTGPNYIRVDDERSTYTLARPTQELIGWSMVGAGMLIAWMPLPARVKTYAPDVTVSPRGVTATKTVRW